MSEQVEKGEWPTDELPEAWEWASFPEFFHDMTDSRRKLPKNIYKQAGIYQVIDQGESQIGGFSDDESLVSKATIPCIVWGDHTRCIKFVKDKFIQGADGVKVLEPTAAVDPAFAYRALQAVRLPDKGYSRHFKFLSSTRFPVAPFPEQRRIVAKLDSVFARTKAARDELARIPLLIEHYKQAILEKAFTGELTADWRQERGLQDAPLALVGTLVSDIRYGTSKKCLAEEHGTAVLRIPNISGGKIVLADLKYAELEEREQRKLALEVGDLLIVRSNGSPDLVGRPALVTEAEQGLAYAGYLIRLRPTPSAVLPEYLKLMLDTPQIRSVIEVSARSTSGVHNINSQELANLKVPRPNLNEQAQIVQKLNAAMEWLSLVATEQGKAAYLLDHLDQSLLSKAFRGEFVPQDPNDEPAEKLLERIRAEPAAQPKTRRGRRKVAG